jgi:hypothetical protein
MREDGSGKNWIVTINSQLRNEQVFIHASWHYDIMMVEYRHKKERI